jgi:DNA-binding phage protein
LIDPIFDDNLSVWDKILQTIENRTDLQVVDYVDDLLNHADNALIIAIGQLSKAKEVSQYSRDRYMYEQGVIDLYSTL